MAMLTPLTLDRKSYDADVDVDADVEDDNYKNDKNGEDGNDDTTNPG